MPDLDLLRKEHVGLAAISLQLSKVVAQPAPPPSHELYKLRMKLTSALVRHLKTEDWVLYPSLLGSSNARVALTSRVFSTEMGGLATEYGDYANRWGADAIDSDWIGYQRETANILRVLTLRMTREERDLYPLLEPAVLERQRTD